MLCSKALRDFICDTGRCSINNVRKLYQTVRNTKTVLYTIVLFYGICYL